MFTGLIQAVGSILGLESRGGDLRLHVDCADLALDRLHAGDSVSVSGVCLTALDIQPGRFSADVSRETLNCTTLGQLQPGTRVNLEPALTLATPLGGHFVSGHVDGVAMVAAITDDGRSQRWSFAAAPELMRYIASKGSVAVDGVSLTVNEVENGCFGVNLIPHTLAHTAFGTLAVGARVNVEVDLIARYVERLLRR